MFARHRRLPRYHLLRDDRLPRPCLVRCQCNRPAQGKGIMLHHPRHRQRRQQRQLLQLVLPGTRRMSGQRLQGLLPAQAQPLRRAAAHSHMQIMTMMAIMTMIPLQLEIQAAIPHPLPLPHHRRRVQQRSLRLPLQPQLPAQVSRRRLQW